MCKMLIVFMLQCIPAYVRSTSQHMDCLRNSHTVALVGAIGWMHFYVDSNYFTFLLWLKRPRMLDKLLFVFVQSLSVCVCVCKSVCVWEGQFCWHTAKQICLEMWSETQSASSFDVLIKNGYQGDDQNKRRNLWTSEGRGRDNFPIFHHKQLTTRRPCETDSILCTLFLENDRGRLPKDTHSQTHTHTLTPQCTKSCFSASRLQIHMRYSLYDHNVSPTAFTLCAIFYFICQSYLKKYVTEKTPSISHATVRYLPLYHWHI